MAGPENPHRRDVVPVVQDVLQEEAVTAPRDLLEEVSRHAGDTLSDPSLRESSARTPDDVGPIQQDATQSGTARQDLAEHRPLSPRHVADAPEPSKRMGLRDSARIQLGQLRQRSREGPPVAWVLGEPPPDRRPVNSGEGALAGPDRRREVGPGLHVGAGTGVLRELAHRCGDPCPERRRQPRVLDPAVGPEPEHASAGEGTDRARERRRVDPETTGQLRRPERPAREPIGQPQTGCHLEQLRSCDPQGLLEQRQVGRDHGVRRHEEGATGREGSPLRQGSRTGDAKTRQDATFN